MSEHTKAITRQELYEKIWKHPLKQIAEELGPITSNWYGLRETEHPETLARSLAAVETGTLDRAIRNGRSDYFFDAVQQTSGNAVIVNLASLRQARS